MLLRYDAMKWATMIDLGFKRTEHENDKFWPFKGEIDVYDKSLHRRVNMIDITVLILKNDQGNTLCGNSACPTLEWDYLPPKMEVLEGWLIYSESFG